MSEMNTVERLASLTSALPSWSLAAALLAVILLLAWVLVERLRQRRLGSRLADTEQQLRAQVQTLA